MDNILKSIVIAAGVLLTIILVGIGFYITRETKSTSNHGLNQINKVNMEGNHVKLSIYDGGSISGSEVVNIIRECKTKPVFMCVKTKACTSLEGTYYNYDYVEAVLHEAGTYQESLASDEDKINKMGKYKCSIKKNKSNVIVGITFVQK